MRATGTGRAVAVLLFCLIVLPLLALALMRGGERAVCWMNDDAVPYCDGYTAVTR